jgi:hypothetical protein
MVGTLIAVYLIGWLLASIAAYVVGRRLSQRETPADHTMVGLVSVAAGAVWPLLVVGLVELSSVMVLTKVPPKPRSSVGIFA